MIFSRQAAVQVHWVLRPAPRGTLRRPHLLHRTIKIVDSVADIFDVSYPETVARAGGSDVTTAPVVKDENGNPTAVSQGTEYKIEDGYNPPEGYKVEVDPNTGVLTVTPPAEATDATEKRFDVPVVVTYPKLNKYGTTLPAGSQETAFVTGRKPEAPHIQDGTEVETVKAGDDQPTTLDDTVVNPTEGMTGDVLAILAAGVTAITIAAINCAPGAGKSGSSVNSSDSFRGSGWHGSEGSGQGRCCKAEHRPGFGS